MSHYFRYVPEFDYVSRLPNAKISDYITVKNLFKRGKIREDIFKHLQFFTKYKIIGNERPDNIAEQIYGDSTFDWVILLANNIVNIQSEWPLSQNSFDTIMLAKYGSYDTLYSGIHHYETTELRNTQGVIILTAGLKVPVDFSITYYDYTLGTMVTQSSIVPITNYQYESTLEDAKRNIFLLKPSYLNVILSDMDDEYPYKKGGSQVVSPTLKRGDNIRLQT